MSPKTQQKALLRTRLLLKHGPFCHWCGCLTRDDVDPNADNFRTIEHRQRVVDGGRTNIRNCRLACRKCNNTRHAPQQRAQAMIAMATQRALEELGEQHGAVEAWL